MLSGRRSGFFVLPFGIDGEPVGCDFWEESKLSKDWLRTCSSFLDAYGSTFDASWAGNLAHIRTQLTSSSGAGLLTFLVRDKLVLSGLLLAGLAPEAERYLVGQFVESLNTAAVVQAATQRSPAFGAIFSCEKRPVLIVVPWPDEAISERDHGIVRELALHLAAAFFAKHRTAPV
jgi:hypothetical protein